MLLLVSFFITCRDNHLVNSVENSRFKIKTETEFGINTSKVFMRAMYEYYDNGLLKSVNRSPQGRYMYSREEYYYNSKDKLAKKIRYGYGYFSIDTVLYSYDNIGKLSLEFTIITTPAYTVYESTTYKYNNIELLIEKTHKPYYDSTARYRYTYEYTGPLLVKEIEYDGNTIIRYFEYEYCNRMKTKELVFTPSNLLESKTIYSYEDGLLINEKSYYPWYGFTVIDGEKIYNYNSNNELEGVIIHEPSISSYVDHRIHYEYY